MPAWLLWQRIQNHHKRQKKEIEEKWREQAFHHFTLSRIISYANAANRDLPPTKKESERKKPDWHKLAQVRDEMKKFMEAHGQGHRNVWEWCQFFQYPNYFEKPKEPEVAPAATLGTFANTKEGRADRKKAVQAMEKRIISRLERIADATGNQEFGASMEEDKPKPAGTRTSEFLEAQGVKQG